jgi:hypothetical protein
MLGFTDQSMRSFEARGVRAGTVIDLTRSLRAGIARPRAPLVPLVEQVASRTMSAKKHCFEALEIA